VKQEGRWVLLGDLPLLYSPKCVEEEFSEVRHFGILGSSHSSDPILSGVLMYRAEEFLVVHKKQIISQASIMALS
jgi:hypothetical protein